MPNLVKRVISGGQTGADQAGLIAANTLDIPTGGWAPKGWLTEDGPAPWLADYGLKEAPSEDYKYRTTANVRDSDATLLFGDPASKGGLLVQDLCYFKHLDKPLFIVNWAGGRWVDPNKPDQFMQDWIRRWLGQWQVKVLNIAGNRESVMPGIGEHVVEWLLKVLG